MPFYPLLDRFAIGLGRPDKTAIGWPNATIPRERFISGLTAASPSPRPARRSCFRSSDGRFSAFELQNVSSCRSFTFELKRVDFICPGALAFGSPNSRFSAFEVKRMIRTLVKNFGAPTGRLFALELFHMNSSKERPLPGPARKSHSRGSDGRLSAWELKRADTTAGVLPRSLAAEPRRKVLAAGSPRGWRLRAIFFFLVQRSIEPRLLRAPRHVRAGAPERLGQPTRSEAQLVPPRVGDARGLITLNPKLLDIRVVKGWATGSRQLGSAE